MDITPYSSAYQVTNNSAGGKLARPYGTKSIDPVSPVNHIPNRSEWNRFGNEKIIEGELLDREAGFGNESATGNTYQGRPEKHPGMYSQYKSTVGLHETAINLYADTAQMSSDQARSYQPNIDLFV